MSMQMRGAILDRVVELHMPFQALTQVACLSNIDRDPTPIFSVLCVNVIPGQGFKSSIQRINLVMIFLSRLPFPIPSRCSRRESLRLPVMTK